MSIKTFEFALGFKIVPQKIIEAFELLTIREATVLKMRFGLEGEKEHTLKEAGLVFMVTPERIRQVEAKALRKLLHCSRRNILEHKIRREKPRVLGEIPRLEKLSR